MEVTSMPQAKKQPSTSSPKRVDKARERAMPKSLRSFPKSERRHIDNPIDDPLAYGSEVRGDCCAPAIQDGDIAMFSPSTAVKAGMYVGLFFKSGERALKRLTFLAPPFKPGDEVSHLH